MSSLDHVHLMAPYNAWMNAKLYDAAAKLSPDELALDRGAFFGSIIGTLNHLIATDLIWLGRLSRHPSLADRLDLTDLPTPTGLRYVAATDLRDLWPLRERIDAVLYRFAATLTDADLDGVLVYNRMDGSPQKKRVSAVLSHVFNHQTHHRGQITTLLTQAGVDIGVTDLLALLPDEA